jgi:general secretion pathway protein K
MTAHQTRLGQYAKQTKLPFSCSRLRRQRGAALLAAMLTVTLVASFAAAAAWQQWRAVEIETAERSRVQAGWILVGALDWARLILREDANSGGADHLAEPWAVPLQEARLSSFLAADKNNTALTPAENDAELFLSGQIVDMQARLNVMNLIDNGKVSEPALASFIKLFALLDLEERELFRLIEGLIAASSNDTSATASSNNRFVPLLPQRIEQLVWLDLPQATLDKLRPFIAMLPTRTPINLNTAPAEVLYASLADLDLEGARRLVTQRSAKHYSDIGDASRLFPTIANQFNNGNHSISSSYFEVRGRLRLENTLVQERSLVFRDRLNIKTLWRERATLPPFEAQASLQ